MTFIPVPQRGEGVDKKALVQDSDSIVVLKEILEQLKIQNTYFESIVGEKITNTDLEE